MQDTAFRWALLYSQVPLSDVPRHYLGMRSSPFLMEYLTTVLKLCPPGVSTLETGIGSGYGAIWLSLRQVAAEGMDYSPEIVERARQINNILEGQARFRVGDLFQLYAEGAPRYRVIHHQGVLEHFTAPQIRAALAQQVGMADWVVFSVPSVNYPYEPEFGDERLLPLEVWRELLVPFDVADLRYYGDPQCGEQEHLLCVLRGQPVTESLLALMYPSAEPYPDGISAIVHTRNEARQIADCLQTLSWADEIIVCDMESEDDTVAIAHQFTDQIVLHPLIQNFDRARNVSAMRAKYRWILYLDADERVPAGLGPRLRELIATQGEHFDALHLPFRHHFAGQWMQCLYPGYTAPRLLKNGKFVFHARLHSGAQVEGRVLQFPADNPDLALVHYSFDSLSHYLTKLNRYTDGEAANMHRDGKRFHWQNALRHFVQDFQGYYEQGQATKDGVHGFLYSFLSAFYRWEQHAKLYETRFRTGQLEPGERAIPANAAEMLQFMLSVATEQPRPRATVVNVQAEADEGAQVVWSGPLLDPSGYGEESRNFLFALDGAGVPVAAQELPWNHDEALLSPKELARLQALLTRPVAPGFVQILQNFPPGFERHPYAGRVIGRTMFETDRLPASWVQACNRVDYIWVPSEFNRQTFIDAGVAAEKLVVIPGCFDPEPYLEPAPSTILEQELRASGRFVFLSVFDWTRHKGWDVLLRAFLEGFEGHEDVTLVLKVWSTMGYDAAAIQAQAQQFVKATLGLDLASDRRVRFVNEKLSRQELLALYQASDAFVLPSRGEGWGRPYLEAMACGLPTIGTNWSGNTAFMTPENSYLVDCRLVAVPEMGWRELPTYQGHRWAEPDREDLIRTMRRVMEEREEAQQKCRFAREEVTARFNREVVGALMAEEILRHREHRGTQRQTTENDSHINADNHRLKAREEGKQEARKTRSQESKNGRQVSSEFSPLPSEGEEQGVRSVRWEGAPFVWHSLAHVNREFCLGLLDSGRVELSVIPTEPTHFDPRQEPRFAPLAELTFATLSHPADVHVRHFFPPRLEQPDEGQFVLMQPWEYGFLPTLWIEPIQENVREVWCYSRYVREVYRASGIAEEKLQIVPLGVDAEVFKPSAPPYVFTTEPGAA
ncbi:MAG TPA: glycosyltransferase, partial [Chthonomonadaceae bacterium]|nr:glycosyltransferase [Chthonomonadaceae bacterium]